MSSRVTLHITHGKSDVPAAVVAVDAAAARPAKVGQLLRRKSLSAAVGGDAAAAASAAASTSAAEQGGVGVSDDTSLEFLVIYGCGGEWCVVFALHCKSYITI